MNKAQWLAGLMVCGLLSQGAIALTPDQVKSIEARLEKEQIQETIIGLKRALKSTPKDKEARFYLAKAYFMGQDLQSAQKELKHAKTLGVDNALWMPLQAQIYLYTQQFDKLLEEFEPSKVGFKDPSAEWVLELKLLRGDAYLSKNQQKEAQAAFRSVLTHQPRQIEAWLGLTQSYLIQKDVDKAQATLDEALKKVDAKRNLKVDAQVQVTQAAIYRLKNDLDSARIAYLHAINLDEDNLQARMGLIELYLLTKNRDNFILQSEKLYSIAPMHPFAMYYQSLALYSKNRTDDAINILEKLTRVKKRHAPAHLLLGYSYYKQKRYEMAAKTLEHYMQLNPEHPGSRAVYGAVMLKLNQPGKTIEYVEPLVAKMPHFQWLAILGHAYVLQGELDKGIETLQKASSMMPQDPAIKVELAASLIANNEGQKAEGLLDEVVQENDYVQAELLRLFVSLKNGKLDKAQEIGAKLVARDSKNPVYHNVLGLALKSLNRLDEAKKHFATATKLAPTFVAATNNLAETHILAKEYNQAETLLDGVLKKDANDLRALYLKSHIAEIQEDQTTALKILKAAQFRNQENPDVTRYIVSYHLRQKQIDKAYLEAQEGVKRFPKNVNLKHLLGQIALHKKDYNQAHDIFDELNEEVPQNVQVLQGLARSQLGLNLVQDAQGSIKHILEKQKNNLSALLLSADIALVQRNYSELREVATKISKRYPENPIGFKLLGDAALGQGNLTEAVMQYQEAYKVKPNQHYAKSYYRALKYSNKVKQGVNLLEAHLKDNPLDSALRQYLATEYLLLKQYDKSKQHYAQAIEDNPSDFISFNNLAHVYLQENNIDKAHELSKKAYEISPESVQVADTYAWTLIQMNESTKAIPILTSAIKLKPELVQLRYHRAVGMFDAGLKQQAKVELEKIVNADVSFEEKNNARALLEKIKQQG